MGRLLIWILGLAVSFMVLPDVSAHKKIRGCRVGRGIWRML